MRYAVDLLTVCTSIAVFLNTCDLMGLRLPLLRPTGSDDDSGFAYAHIVFYIQFITWYFTMILALTHYRSLKHELCFHCKYGFFMIQSLNILLLMTVVMEYTPYWSILFSFSFLMLVYMSRAESKKNRMRKREQHIE